MKRIIFLILFIVSIFINCISSYAASVIPTTYAGDDRNSDAYQERSYCLKNTLPNSNTIGTHEYRFNENGVLGITGINKLTIVVGLSSDESHTQIVSWSWSGEYKVQEIIINGEESFSVYNYSGNIAQDSELIAPIDESGSIQNIDHISVVISPPEKYQTLYTRYKLTVISLLGVIFLMLTLIFIKINKITKILKYRKYEY